MKKLLLLYLLTIIGINMAYSQSKTGIYKTFYENGKVKKSTKMELKLVFVNITMRMDNYN